MKTVLDINILHKRTREKHKKICDSYKKRIVNTTRNESVLQLISQMNFLDGQRFVVIKFDVKSYFDNFDEVTSRDLLRRKSSFLYKKLSVYRHVHSVSIQTGEGIKAGLPLSNLIGEIMGEEIVMSLWKLKGLIRIFRYVDDYIVFVKKKECKEISDSIKKVVRDRGLEFSEFSVIPPKDGRYKINFLGYSLLKTKRKKTIVEISTKKIYKKVLSKIDSINSDSTMNEHDRKKMLQFYIYGGEFILENKTIIRWGVKFAYPLAVSGLNKPADNKHIRRKLCSISFPPKSKGMNLKSIKSLYKRIVYTHPEYKSIKSGVVGKIKSVERYISDLSKKQKTAFYKSIPKVMR